MVTKKTYPRIQSKIVKKWKAEYRLNGIEISYNRFGTPTWEMRSTNSRFVTYQGAIPIKDITELEKNDLNLRLDRLISKNEKELTNEKMRGIISGTMKIPGNLIDVEEYMLLL